jgi:hypothetical protein
MAAASWVDAHRFMFGDKLEQTVADVTNRAVSVGTAESFLAAAEQLHGISFLLLHLGFAEASFRLSNEQRNLMEFAEDDTLRERRLAEMKSAAAA